MSVDLWRVGIARVAAVVVDYMVGVGHVRSVGLVAAGVVLAFVVSFAPAVHAADDHDDDDEQKQASTDHRPDDDDLL